MPAGTEVLAKAQVIGFLIGVCDFYGPYYMELRIDDLMAHCDFKT